MALLGMPPNALCVVLSALPLVTSLTVRMTCKHMRDHIALVRESSIQNVGSVLQGFTGVLAFLHVERDGPEPAGLSTLIDADVRVHGGSLAYLALKNLQVTDADILALCAGAKCYTPVFPNLAHLDLSENQLGNQSWEAMSQGLFGMQLVNFFLSGNAVCAEGAESLALCIEQCKKLGTLDLERCRMTWHESSIILHALGKHAVVKDLNIGGSHLFELGEAEHCLMRADVLCFDKLSRLQTLKIDRTNLQDAGVRHVLTSLVNLSSLKALDLRQNTVSFVKSFVMLEIFSHLTDLLLGGDCIMQDQWSVFSLLSHTRSLVHVDLSGCKLDDSDALELDRALRTTTTRTIKGMNLSGNFLESEGIRVVMCMCRDHNMTALNLGPIRPRAFHAFEHGLEGCADLTSLWLQADALDTATLKAIMPHLSSLLLLGLAKNDLEDPSATCIAQGLSQMPSLKYLDLNNNMIGKEGAEAIIRGTYGHTSLVAIELCNNVVDVNVDLSQYTFTRSAIPPQFPFRGAH